MSVKSGQISCSPHPPWGESSSSVGTGSPDHGARQVLYEGGPITVTGVPMGVSGQTWAAVAMGISTHPLLWGVP